VDAAARRSHRTFEASGILMFVGAMFVLCTA
jgi:hypothetical protein